MRVTTRRRRLCVTSWLRGTRSWTSIASTSPDRRPWSGDRFTSNRSPDHQDGCGVPTSWAQYLFSPLSIAGHATRYRCPTAEGATSREQDQPALLTCARAVCHSRKRNGIRHNHTHPSDHHPGAGEGVLRSNPLAGMRGPSRPQPRPHHTLSEVRQLLRSAEVNVERATIALAVDPKSPGLRRLLFSAEQGRWPCPHHRARSVPWRA